MFEYLTVLNGRAPVISDVEIATPILLLPISNPRILCLLSTNDLNFAISTSFFVSLVIF